MPVRMRDQMGHFVTLLRFLFVLLVLMTWSGPELDLAASRPESTWTAWAKVPLTVRREPNRSSPAIAFPNSGDPVTRFTGQTKLVDGTEWAKVRTAGGEIGWCIAGDLALADPN